jgi:hypothetical protein
MNERDALSVWLAVAGGPRDRIGAAGFFTNDEMVFAQRLDKAINSLNVDIQAAGWDGKQPQLSGAWAIFVASWKPFFDQTQDVHSILVGPNADALSAFQVQYEQWRSTYASIEGHAPTAPDPVPVAPGENTPQVNIGGGAGLGFGVGIAVVGAGLFLLLRKG